MASRRSRSMAPKRRSWRAWAPVVLERLAGTVLVGTDRGRDGEAVSGSLRLAPGEGAVVELA